MKLFSRIHSGYLFLFSFLTAFVITPLFQKGLFGDGLMYLTVAFNRFRGYGSFWNQHYSNTSMAFFCEQPPLYFESLGAFYKLFGGAEIAEKVFTMSLLLATVWLTARVWRRLGPPGKKLGWIPSLLMFCVPVFSWSFCNQVIETMVVPLALLAFYLQLRFIQEDSPGRRAFFLGGALLMLLALFLTKGVQSVFLVAGVLLASFVYKRRRPPLAAAGALLLLFFAAMAAALFLLNEGAGFWLHSYFDKRLVATFHNKGATAMHHFEIIARFFSELLPVIGACVLVSWYTASRHRYSLALQWRNFKQNPTAHWLLLIALSASMPLAVTLEQRGFYLSPAFPFMTLALASYYRRQLVFVVGSAVRRRESYFLAAGGTLMLAALAFFGFKGNEYKRDEGMIRDVEVIMTHVEKGETIGINQSTWNTFSLHSYLNKANDNSLAVTDTLRYFVQEKENTDPVPDCYTKMAIHTYAVDLYKRRAVPQ